jgi:hypothetical protein
VTPGAGSNAAGRRSPGRTRPVDPAGIPRSPGLYCGWPGTTKTGATGGSPENWPGWAFTVAPSTVWEILKKHRIEPAPRRHGPSWAQFPRSQAEAIIACDFFTIDVLDGTKAFVMAVIEHAARRIHILGATAHPTHEWVTQQTRNLLLDLDESACQIKFLIRDRDILYRRHSMRSWPTPGSGPCAAP